MKKWEVVNGDLAKVPTIVTSDIKIYEEKKIEKAEEDRREAEKRRITEFDKNYYDRDKHETRSDYDRPRDTEIANRYESTRETGRGRGGDGRGQRKGPRDGRGRGRRKK